MCWQHHYRGGHRIHGPHRVRLWRDGTGMAGVKSTAPGNDVAGSMSFPLPLESQSLVPLPGSPPYEAPRAATWAVDYCGRAGQLEIGGHCCPGQGRFWAFRRRAVPPTFGVAPTFSCSHSCRPQPCLHRQESMFLPALDNVANQAAWSTAMGEFGDT